MKNALLRLANSLSTFNLHSSKFRRSEASLVGLFALAATLSLPASSVAPLRRLLTGPGNALSTSSTARNLETSSPLPQSAVGNMNTERRGHTATLLSNGKVLVTGGENANGLVTSAEIFDPATEGFSVSGNLNTPRTEHTGTRLSDGRVLIAGGRGAPGPLSSTEIFEPATGVFSAGPNLIVARSAHTATVLADGRIVLAGGDAAGSLEIYDPLLNVFTPVAASLSAARESHSAALLDDGNILIVGGSAPDGSPVLSGEIFNIGGSTFSSVDNQTQNPHIMALLRLLPDGKVQIIGGTDHETLELYDPNINKFGAHAHVYPLGDSHPALLQEILSSPMRTALFRLGASSTLLNRTGQTITELPESNRALIAGGVDSSGAFLNSASALSSSPAMITTDKLDYRPNTPVIVSGSGWQPNEVITLMFHEDPHVETENPHTFTVAADPNGNFVYQEYAPEELDNGITFILAAKGGSSGWTAQTAFTDTDPTPQPIPYSQDFSALLHSSTAYPPGWQGWQLSTSGSSTSFRTTTATADLALNANSSAGTATGGVHNYNGKLGILATGSSDPALALAIDTTGHSNVTASFDIMTIRNPYDGGSNTRIGQVDLQYRVGTTGSFTSVSGLANGIYQNNTTTQTGAGVTTPQKLESKSLMLPAAVDNQAVVQLRWVQRDLSGGGSRASFAVDNVALTFISPPAITSANAATFTVGSAGIFTVMSTGSPTPAISQSGMLPTGVTFSDNGNGTATLSGTPASGTAGSYSLIITATNGALPDATQNFTLTVVGPGILQFSAANYDDPETNSGAHAKIITVQRTGGSAGAVEVSYATSDGTATLADNDYLASSGTLHWNDGDSADKTFAVMVKGDTTFEPDETVNLTLSAPTNGAVLGGTNPATLTIQNDDPAPNISIDDVTHDEGNAGTTSYDFTVNLSNASYQTVTVDYATADDTANAPGDYTAAPTTTLTFVPGETSKQVTVLVNGDNVFEATETFLVNLFNETNATISDHQGVGSIQNDDSQPTVQFSSISSSGIESSSPVNLEVTLSNESYQTVTVNYAVNGSSTATGGGVDYTLLGSGTLTFNPGVISGNVSFIVNDDIADENDETVIIDLSAPVNATLGAPTTHAYTIQDNDPAPDFIISDVTLAEGHSGTTDFIFTVTRTGLTALTTTVDYATANGTTNPATGGVVCDAGVDYESQLGTLTFAPTDTTMTVSVKVCGDTMDEANETFFVNLSGATNAGINNNQGVGTITNDDTSSYSFEGFLAPVDNLPVVNTVKAGSAVPVKWRLTTGGAPVSDPNSFAGLFSYEINCGTTTGLETPVETLAPGGSGLQYFGNGNWQINWKTLPNYPRGSCRLMELRLNDGTSYYANFKFK